MRVEVKLKDGTQHAQTVEAPRGSEQKFASEADVIAKFGKLARRTLRDADAERVATIVLGCDKLADVALLVKALTIGVDATRLT